jgi:hypothetical protein
MKITKDPVFNYKILVTNGKKKTQECNSLGFGLYPFRDFSHRYSIFPDVEKPVHGVRVELHYIQETGVQFRYTYNPIRKYYMNDPKDYEEYWNNRQAVKAAFLKMTYGGK